MSKRNKSKPSGSHRHPHRGPNPPHRAPLKGVEKVGVVHLHERGFGFFIPQDGSPDAFLPPREVRDLMHGDTIKARVAPDSHKEGKFSATYISIVKRGRQSIVGILFKERGQMYLKPSDPKLITPMRLLPGKISGTVGHAVVAQITAWPAKGKELQGQLIEILGDPSKPGVDMLMVVRKHDWPDKHSQAAMAEASKYPANPGPNDWKGRTDLRNLPLLTIDGEDARDFDDAVSIEKTRTGYRLGVHIADVSHYVREGGVLDLEARERATSLYLPDRCLPMLPHSISDGLCSLKADVPRLAVSVFMQFPFGSGLPTETNIELSVIQSRCRGIYEEVQQILDGRPLMNVREKYEPVSEVLRNLRDLSKLVRAEREKRGSIDFDFPEVKAILDKDGRTMDVHKVERLDAHRLIEDFMIAANEAVATDMTNKKSPGLYRVHEPPSIQDQDELVKVLKAYKIPFRPQDLVRPSGLQALLHSIKGGPYEHLVSYMALRSLKMAVYSTRNLGHFGLASTSYCHFTSPIRRYPDLVVHRALKASRGWGASGHSAGPKLDQLALHCSERERLAESAERDGDKLKLVQFMMDKVGRVYDGVIAGLSPYGAYVELLPYGLEGFLPLQNFRGDKVTFDQDNMVLKTKRGSIKLGDKLKVKVETVDLATQRITLVNLDA